MANQFEAYVPSALQALMAGEQSYKEARANRMQNDQAQARQEAMAALQNGGDPKSAIARLLGAGDVQGATAYGAILNNESQRDLQKQQLGLTSQQIAEAARHNKASEGIAAEAANKPMILPFGSGMVDRKGNILREPTNDGLLDSDTITAMAHQLRAGDTSVLTNLGRGAQGAQNVIAVRKKVAELNAAQGEGGAEQANRNAEFFGVKSGQRTLGNKQANIEMAATEFQQVLPVVQKASLAVSRTNYPDLNKIIQAYETKTGDPAIVAFGGGVNTLVNLYSRAISPNGTPTVADKEHAREILGKAWSQGQFDAAVGMMKQEIDAALSSPEKVREEMRKRFIGGQTGGAPQGATAAPATGATPSAIPAPPPGFQLVK